MKYGSGKSKKENKCAILSQSTQRNENCGSEFENILLKSMSHHHLSNATPLKTYIYIYIYIYIYKEQNNLLSNTVTALKHSGYYMYHLC
jgi:hypothetical protein